jgi:menaquinone-dependent protoporphyrinogen oxidase
MNDKILVTYATAAGSTAEVAQAMAKTVSGDNGAVDVLRVKEVKDLSSYRSVVVGSGIRNGRVYRAALNFLKQHQMALSQVAVAYFIVCMSARDETEEGRTMLTFYGNQMRSKAPQIQPVDVGFFAGKVDPETLPLPSRLIVRALKSEEGDFRDWDAIRGWASSLSPALLAE